MNITDIAKIVSKKSKKQSIASTRRILSSTFEEIAKQLVFGATVNVKNFGAFSLVIHKPKVYTDFHTKVQKKTEKRYIIKFKPAMKLDKKIKNKTVY